jgi:uncharacterized membrane protein
MRMRNEIIIHAPVDDIFALARDTARWPQILPHYRSVRVLKSGVEHRTVEMAARRGWIPVRWRADQIDDFDTPRIRFVHTAGWTRGMQVEWLFQPMNGSTRVSIDHELHFAFPLAGEYIGRRVIGGFFVDYIATRTLRRIKELAERHAER